MAYDKELQLADNETVAASDDFEKTVDLGAASNVFDDVFYTVSGNATTAGTILIRTSVDGTTFTTVATVTLATGTGKQSVRLPYKGVGRYLKAASGTAAGTFTIDASIGVSVQDTDRNSAPYDEANEATNHGYGNGDPVMA